MEMAWRWRGDGAAVAGARPSPAIYPPQVRLRQAMVLVYAALLGSSAAPDLLELASQVLGYCCLAK